MSETDFHPFVDRDPKDFLAPVPTLVERIRLTAKYMIKALPPSILVVDLSHWNDEIDFAALRASGVQAVIIKCSEGAEGTYYQFKDPRFEENWRKAIGEGFPVMVYHFFRDNKGSAEKSWFMKCADDFLNLVDGHTACWLDVEWTGSGISTSARASRAFGFCDLIKGEGLRQGIYSSPGLVSRLFPPGDLRWANVFQWVAHWTSAQEYSLPSGWSRSLVKGWQFGISPTHSWVPLINGAGRVDANHFYFDSEDALRSWLGLDTTTPPPVPPTHEHPELQAQIDVLKQSVADLFAGQVAQNEAIIDLDARYDSTVLDITDINERLQRASVALKPGGDE